MNAVISLTKTNISLTSRTEHFQSFILYFIQGNRIYNNHKFICSVANYTVMNFKGKVVPVRTTGTVDIKLDYLFRFFRFNTSPCSYTAIPNIYYLVNGKTIPYSAILIVARAFHECIDPNGSEHLCFSA